MATQLPLSITLRVDARFNNFLLTENNQLAVNALRHFFSSANDQLIYIWGSSGSGVSHLLQAVQQDVTNAQIQYLPIKDVIAYPAQSICQGLENLDLVVIDNIEQIAGHPQWQEQIFYLFNKLKDSGKKLLIGANKAPNALSLSLADLQSRLQWCEVYRIEELTDKEKQQVLVNRADDLGMSLDQSVAQYIIQRYSRNMKLLIAALHTLDKASLSKQRLLTIPFVKQTLEL